MQKILSPILHKQYYDNMYIAILLFKKRENLRQYIAFVVVVLPSTEKMSEKEIV